MNKLYIIIVSIFVLLSAISLNSFGQKNKSADTLKIQTSARCGMCKDRIEKNMAFEKGVKDVILDEDTKIVTIIYKTGKTNPDALRKAISKLGYDADDVPADKEAHDKLPACCQKSASPH